MSKLYANEMEAITREAAHKTTRVSAKPEC